MTLVDEVNELLKQWETEHNTLPVPEHYPKKILQSIADSIDKAKAEVSSLNLDPYDDFKNVSENVESEVIKTILDHEFLEVLTTVYLTGSRYAQDEEVHILAARIMASAMNGIDYNAYFKDVEEDMVDTLYRWALANREPLTSYAVEMLSYGESLCGKYHQSNMELIKLLLSKLKTIHQKARDEYNAAHSPPQANIAPWDEDTQDGGNTADEDLLNPNDTLIRTELVGQSNFEFFQCQAVLHFLLSLGEYQEFLGLIMKNNIPKLLLNYISITDINSVLIFDIIRYLSALLCHKKFASDFMNYDGLQLLMDLPFNQRASTGISTCLYALVFHSTVMERLCAHKAHLIPPMISMCLKLLKGKHESARSHVTLYLTLAFQYRPIIEEFDIQNGLDHFVDILKATTAILIEPPSNELLLFLHRQKLKHVCNALHRYIACHTLLYAEHTRRVKDHHGVGMSPQIYMNNKALELEDNLENAFEYIQSNAEFDSIWTAMDSLHKLGGFEVAMNALFISEDWRSVRYDATSVIISLISFMTLLPRYQLKLTEPLTTPTGETQTAIKFVLQAAEDYNNIDVQKAALGLIIGVVCGPYRANASNLSHTQASQSRKTSSDDVMHKMWSAIRTNNGIKVLMSLLLTKTPICHADELRTAACKALNGLCRSRGVRQIASKLHLMSSGQLLALMREPVLPENIETHTKFCTYTGSLLEVLFGVSTERATNEPSLLNKMTKADIVSKTPITFDKDELYYLLHSTLIEQGLKSTANMLVDEIKNKLDKDILFYPKKQETLPTTGSSSSSSHLLMSPITPCKKLYIKNSRSRAASAVDETPETPTPSKHKVPQKSVGVIEHLTALDQKNKTYQPPSLDDLVHNFMREQHMKCEYPMSIVPPFSLFREHLCPSPQPKYYEAPVNMVMRQSSRQYLAGHGGISGRYRNYKYIYSKFRPYYTYKLGNRNEEWDDINLTSCLTFSNYIVSGCNNGQIKVYEMSQYPPYNCIQTTQPSLENPDCDPITSLAISSSEKLLASTSTSDPEFSHNNLVIWSVGANREAGAASTDVLEHRHEIPGVDHVSFSYNTDDYLLCTMDNKCCIVDCYTGRIIHTMKNPHGSNSYYKNHAVFNFTDELVLNDGVLWDFRTPSPIHKFDKFNNFVSGVFSPSGIDIIINTEVWDIRTYKLLNTINSLDNCLLKYNNSRDVMFGLSHVKKEVLDHEISPAYKHVLGPFESTFKTFYTKNEYSSLGTFDVRKQIIDFSFCRSDRMVVTIETANEDFTTMWSGGSSLRIYLIGRSRGSRGDEDDEDDNEDDDDDSSTSSEDHPGDFDDDSLMSAELIESGSDEDIFDESVSDIESDINMSNDEDESGSDDDSN